MSSSSRLVFTVWCSAAIWAAFVLAKDSESSSSEEGYSGEKHGHDCGKHHHDHSDGSHRHHHHHHHPRFHHSRHHHHHHHHGPNKNITSTTLSNSDITTTLSPVQGNDLDPQIGNADVGIAFSTTTTASSTDLGIIEHQPDNGGIDLRGSKAVEQTDNNLTTNGENAESLDAFLENLGNDQILTTSSSSTPSETTNELISESTNSPTAASEHGSELLN